jgi:hypothetical protein
VPDPEDSAVGLAMGAIGLATGPGSGRDARLELTPGAMFNVGIVALFGGPIGAVDGGCPPPPRA